VGTTIVGMSDDIEDPTPLTNRSEQDSADTVFIDKRMSYQFNNNAY